MAKYDELGRQVGAQADAEIAGLRAVSEQYQASRDAAIADVNALTEQNRVLRTEQSRLTSQVATLTGQVASLQAELDALKPEPPAPPAPSNGLVKGTTLLGAATSNIAGLESKVGKLGVYRSYFQASQVAGMVQRAQADHAAGRIPWISSKLPFGWADMAAGRGDAWAKDLAAKLGALGKPVWIALHHEPEGDGVTADWVKLQQRLAPIFKAHSNIAYSIILMGWGQWMSTSQPMASWWPGRQHVDLLAFDPYNWYDTTNAGSGRKSYAWDELKVYYDKIVAWLKASGNEDVAWGIAETGYTNSAALVAQSGKAPNGSTVSPRGSGADWLTRAYDDMKAMGGSVLAYFDVSAAVNNEPSDWTWPLSSDPKVATFRKVLARADKPVL